jgi:hypothetical protein
MKEKLREKLERPDIDRNFFWFWKNWVKPKVDVTYQHFMFMLNGSSPLREDVKEAIQYFLDLGR